MNHQIPAITTQEYVSQTSTCPDDFIFDSSFLQTLAPWPQHLFWTPLKGGDLKPNPESFWGTLWHTANVKSRPNVVHSQTGFDKKNIHQLHVVLKLFKFKLFT